MGGVIKGVTGAVGSLLGGGPKVSAPAPPPAPAPMPTPDDAALNAAKKKEIAAQVLRSGRMSTILSQNGGTGTSDKLGG